MNRSANSRSVAVVGAGIAGLAAAAELVANGHQVTVFDKGRKPGGRVATRRDGGVFFDHGAQFATARAQAFGQTLDRLQVQGHVAPWPTALEKPGEIAWVGTPAMSALPFALAETLTAQGVKIHTDTHVGWVSEDRMLTLFPAATTSPGFVSSSGGMAVGPFDAVLLAIPAPQAMTLMAALGHRFAAAIATVRYAPCWAVMLSFSESCNAPDVLRPENSPLAWIARNSARPGHASTPEAWVLHAGAEWSRAHLEETPDEVLGILLAEFSQLTGQTTAPLTQRAHRWRYALVERALGQHCLWDAQSRIGLCGDFCIGARVEAAFESGRALARTAMESLFQ